MPELPVGLIMALLPFIAAMGFAAFGVAVTGLIIGGSMAAPLGAIVAKRIAAKLLLLLVGTVLTATSLFSLYRAIGWQ